MPPPHKSAKEAMDICQADHLQTIHHTDGARWLVQLEEEPRLRVEWYHRPGAHEAVDADGSWVACGWVRKKDQEAVLNLVAVGGGAVGDLSCVLHDKYLKEAYYVVKEDVTL
ncbi:hypothetical protein Bbelb_316610 [Branchiostoma belcheri]|nr:hypothetical protein Bbelb_316610 [Branchiostoma belcheri]